MSSLQMFVRGGAMLALVLVLAAPLAASAQDAAVKESPVSGMGSGCAAFKWPLEVERKAFEDIALEKVASGTARGGWKDQAFALTLQPDAEVAYTLPPAKKKKDAAGPRFGGIIAFAAPEKGGAYQVTLSEEGWIDLIQQGASLHSSDHSGVKDCPGLRKSVRFTVGEAPVVLQISGAPGESVKVAIRAVE